MKEKEVGGGEQRRKETTITLPSPAVSSGRRIAQESSADDADRREGERAHASRGKGFMSNRLQQEQRREEQGNTDMAKTFSLYCFVRA